VNPACNGMGPVVGDGVGRSAGGERAGRLEWPRWVRSPFARPEGARGGLFSPISLAAGSHSLRCHGTRGRRGGFTRCSGVAHDGGDAFAADACKCWCSSPPRSIRPCCGAGSGRAARRGMWRCSATRAGAPVGVVPAAARAGMSGPHRVIVNARSGRTYARVRCRRYEMTHTPLSAAPCPCATTVRSTSNEFGHSQTGGQLPSCAVSAGVVLAAARAAGLTGPQVTSPRHFGTRQDEHPVKLKQTGISLAGMGVTSKPHVIRERVPPISGLGSAARVIRAAMSSLRGGK
jgi:hypothetical protein